MLSRICDGNIGKNGRNSDAPAAENMLPKLLEVPINTYLMVLAKIRRPSATPSARTFEVLLQQDHVGGVLGDIGGGVNGDPDVGGVQREGVVDAVAEECHGAAAVALDTHDAGLIFWADPSEHRGAM